MFSIIQGWKYMSCSSLSRVVSTSMLAPDWLHKSEQPIRSKLTKLLTMTQTQKFPLQPLPDGSGRGQHSGGLGQHCGQHHQHGGHVLRQVGGGDPTQEHERGLHHQDYVDFLHSYFVI